MAMMVRPKRYMGEGDFGLALEKILGGDECRYTGDLKWLPMEGGLKEGVIFECEVLRPPSAAGRTVYFFLEPSDVTAVLLVLRDSAKEARR